MQDIIYLVELLDRAKSVVGSDYQIAKMLDVPRSHVSAWRHGKRTATPEDQALIAGLAGLDAAAWLARATVTKHEGTPKGERLLKVLGKALPATTAASFTGGASAAEAFSQVQGGTWLEWLLACSTMYRKVKLNPPESITARFAAIVHSYSLRSVARI